MSKGYSRPLGAKVGDLVGLRGQQLSVVRAFDGIVPYFDAASARDEEIVAFLDGMTAIAARQGQFAFTVTVRMDRRFAAECLRRSRGNPRGKSSPGVVLKYRREAADGWHNTGEPISFDVHRVMVEGHHRCEAVAEASDDLVVEVSVHFGLTDLACTKVNSGFKRAQWQRLGTDKNANAIAKYAICCLDKLNSRDRSDTEVEQMSARLQPVLSRYARHFHSNGAPMSVVAVMVLAALADDRFSAFINQMYAPEFEDVHPTIRMLRKQIRDRRIAGSAGGKASVQLQLYTMMALRGFVSKGETKMLRLDVPKVTKTNEHGEEIVVRREWDKAAVYEWFRKLVGA